MKTHIILTFDSYAEFMKSLTPEAIDELMADKEPVITDENLAAMFKELMKEEESDE